MKLLLIPIVGTILILGASVAYERMLWNECRASNSFFYCIRVLT